MLNIELTHSFFDNLQFLSNIENLSLILHSISFIFPSFSNSPISQRGCFSQSLFGIM